MFAKLRRRDTLPPPVSITDEYLAQILVELRILNNCELPEDPDPNTPVPEPVPEAVPEPEVLVKEPDVFSQAPTPRRTRRK